MYNIYFVKTNIKVKANTFLNINILAEDLSDATSSASYLKYNGEELKRHIISVELIVSNVIRDTWNVSDLNPDYKEESKDNQEALPPADNI
nr:MAG TPA: hypothetical protein [Crassvirales sp.]